MTDIAIRDALRLDDPRWYVGDPHEVYAKLRSEAPVLWDDRTRTWVVTRYRDIHYVASKPELFSSADGIFIHEALADGSAADALFAEGGEQLSSTDPPRHRVLRQAVGRFFTASAIERLRPRVTELAGALLDAVEPGTVLDWVESFAAILPIQTACTLLALPLEDAPKIREWSDRLERISTGPLTPAELDEVKTAFQTMNPYIAEHLAARRDRPGDDLLSNLLKVNVDQERLSEANITMFAQTVIAAGNDTTRALLSAVVAVLSEFEDQRAMLRATDGGLYETAIEEILRWWPPARGFLRTATADCRLADQDISRGEHVYLAFDAGNRDETAFPDASTFDITRPRRPGHLAFGFSTHFCLGAPLARLQADIVLRGLCSRFRSWRIQGEPQRSLSLLRQGWTYLPVTFEALA